MRSRLPRLFPLLLAAACAEVPEGPPGADPPDPDAVPDPDTALIRTPEGLRRVHFVEVDGRAIYDGDIDLGPVETVRGGLFGGGVHKDFGRRWPNGVVRYRYDSSMPSSTRSLVEAQLTALEAVSPLEFVNIGASESGGYLEYRWDGTEQGKGVSDQIGRSGGEQAVTFSTKTPGPRLILHETLHAVGFWHEQSRPDRDAYVVIDNDCINWSLWDWENDQKQYEIKGDARTYGPYDYASIMHYGTGTWCVSPQPAKCTLWWDTNGNGVDENWCATMVKTADGSPIPPAQTLSRDDLNMLWRMHGAAVGSSQAADHFGRALATGDFDGDGYEDLAVGVPDDDGGASALDSGRVHVFRGTSKGLVPWKSLSQINAGWSDDTGDHFGAALAAGDVDGDGIDDLLVGVPGEDVAAGGSLFIDAGGAILFKGGPTGFSKLFDYTQSSTSAGSEGVGDNFGAAVAIGKLSGMITQDVIIGAPGDRYVAPFVGTIAGGAVYVFHSNFDPGAIQGTPTRLYQVSNPAGARFGAALAVRYLDDGSNEDLLIGAPGAGDGGRGAVFAYAGRSPTNNPPPYWTTTELATFRQRISAPAGADDFGAALAIGDLRGGWKPEVAIGAPLAEGGSGRVYVYQLTGTTLGANSLGLVQTVDQNGSLDGDDRFGAAIVIGQVMGDNTGELIVGAPGENGGEGAVSVFQGNYGDLTDGPLLRQTGVPFQGLNEAGDDFGAALALGQIDGVGEKDVSSDDWTGWKRADLIVGAPGEAPEVGTLNQQGPSDAGAIYLFFGTTSGPVGGFEYHQASASAD